MLVRRVAFVSSTAVLLAGFVNGAACTHDREAEPPPIDAPRPDVVQVADAQQLPVTVLEDGVDKPADLSCLEKSRPDAGVIYPAETGSDAGADADADADEAGTDDASAADTSIELDSTAGDAEAPTGTLVDTQVELIGFGTGGSEKLGDQIIDIYYGNTFKLAPNLTVTSDAMGLFRAPLPAGLRVAYHVRASKLLGDYYALDDLHLPFEPLKPVRWQGVTLERQETLALAITGQKGYTIKPGTGIIAGRVMDCKRRYMQHAKVVLMDYTDNAAGVEREFVRCGTGLCLVYLNDAELPDVGRHATSRSSLFSMIDVPTGRKLRLVARGIDGNTGVEKPVAWRNLEVKDGGIAIHILEPDASTEPPSP